MGLVVAILDSTGLAPGPWVSLGCPPESSHKAPGVLQLPPLPASASFPPTAPARERLSWPRERGARTVQFHLQEFYSRVQPTPREPNLRGTEPGGSRGGDGEDRGPHPTRGHHTPNRCATPFHISNVHPSTQKTLVKTAPKD